VKVVDAVWELRNLGKRTIEVKLEKKDFSREPVEVYADIEDAEKIYHAEYTVVKMKTGYPQVGWELQKNGFWHVETQICLRAFYDDVKSCVFQYEQLYSGAEQKTIDTYDDVTYIKNEIEKGIFSTDRIALDPFWGIKVANHRYANWVEDEYKRGSELSYISVEGKNVGFVLHRIENKVRNALLTGVFPQFRSGNYGAFVLYAGSASMIKKNIKVSYGDVSSNNPAILALNEMFGSRVRFMYDVYTRHK